MIIAITGTPGVGKTSVSDVLKEKKYNVLDFNKIAVENKYIIGIDDIRNSKIVDIKKLEQYIKNLNQKNKIVIIDSHISHLFKIVNKVVILRCHPEELKKRLLSKKWNIKKINENIEAEILDIILCETIDIHNKNNIFEIDTTGKSAEDIAQKIIEIIETDFSLINKYNIGKIDWSYEILKNFNKGSLY